MKDRNKDNIVKAGIVVSLCFYILSAIMLYKGYDKMTNYYNSDIYFSHNENAYVGGDAYNYIINGTYATGFFVLSMGFLLSGIICSATTVILNNSADKEGISDQTGRDYQITPEIEDELPEL